MGSVIGMAPASNPGTGNTTRLFYDGFGNSRATNGPAPTIPSGAGGDFRFHGAWLEADSGLYHMRAREYDARVGRFTSRDPRNGVFQRAETLNPYVYAANNPQVFTDPSGEFTLIEINISQLIDTTVEGLKDVAINQAKQYLKNTIFKAVSNVIINQLGDIYPPLGEMWKALKSGDLAQAGRNFESAFKKQICGAIGADGPVVRLLWFYPGIRPENGNVDFAGLNCPNLSAPKLVAGLRYPDFLLSEVPPTDTTGTRASGKSIVIGDVKLSGNSLYYQYVKSGPQNKRDQFDAITRYARQGTYSRTAVFLTVFTGQKSKLQQVQMLLCGDGLKEGLAVVVVAAFKNKGFNDVE
jgi:RHS repeat-associated protein